MGRQDDPRDTNIGGANRGFPSTCWTEFLYGMSGDPEQARTALERLADHYWKPIYAYIRTKWAKSNEDAKDLTQAFFLWMMEGDFVSRADRERGRFRAFVRVALRHFLTEEYRKGRTIKRGGGAPPLSLEALAKEAGPAMVPDAGGKSPDAVLDDLWREELFTRGVERLEELYAEEGKAVHFAVFREYYLSEKDELDYDVLAARHGLRRSDVANYLFRAKQRFREVLTELVAQTVGGADDLKEELRLLFGEEKE